MFPLVLWDSMNEQSRLNYGQTSRETAGPWVNYSTSITESAESAALQSNNNMKRRGPT